MQREIALVYSRDARPAGSSGTRPGHYAPGEVSGARPVPGVTEFVEPEVVPAASCSATTRAGNPCCLLYTSPSPRDGLLSRMPSSA